MKAHELSDAARALRKRADAATEAPWVTNTQGYIFGATPGDEIGKVRAADASFVAMVNPALALAVADWLEEVADRAYYYPKQYRGASHADAIARLIQEAE